MRGGGVGGGKGWDLDLHLKNSDFFFTPLNAKEIFQEKHV